MSSPQVSFRLSAYQLARGLKVLRAIEPTYIPPSLSQMVKTLYLDYISKTSLNKADEITDLDIAEIHNLIKIKTRSMNLSDFQQATREANSVVDIPTNQPSSKSIEKSTISSVSDFSPPNDWAQEADEKIS